MLCKKTRRQAASRTIEELAYSNMFMVEALFELLAEKGILNGVEVKERVKKLQAETKLNFPRIQ